MSLRDLSKYALLLWLAGSSTCSAKTAYVPREGDILFQTSRSAQSQAIQLATHSRWSHVGLVYFQHGKSYVLEAVQPVKLTPLSAWIARGTGHHFVARRLVNAGRLLTPPVKTKMRAVGKQFLGKNYDLYFGWSDSRIYCSELVWKVYARGAGIHLGSLEKLHSFDLGNPVVKAKLRERYGNHPPLDEPVISPAAIYASDRLKTVYRQ